MLQIGLLIWGIVILCQGRVKLTRKKQVAGTPARMIGILFVGTLPFAFAFGFGLGIYCAATNTPIPETAAMALDFGILGVAIVGAFLIAGKYGVDPEQEPLGESTTEFFPSPQSHQAPTDPDNPYSSPQFEDR